MELRVDRNDGNLTRISLSGKLDVAGEQAIGNEFRDLIHSHNTHFLIDMSHVTYLASLGIRLLFAGAKALAAGKQEADRSQPATNGGRHPPYVRHCQTGTDSPL